MRSVNIRVAIEKLLRACHQDTTRGQKAQRVILSLINRRPHQVFWERQLKILFEPHWSHAVTARALDHLREAKLIETKKEKLLADLYVRFYWNRRLPAVTRDVAIANRRALLLQTAGGEVGPRIGEHAEQLVSAAFRRLGGTVLGIDTNSTEEREYEGESKMRLDLIVRVADECFGIEMKNTLDFPNPYEMEEKRDIAQAIGTRPVLITRNAPASWDAKYRERGGFIWRLGRQVFPPELAELGRALSSQCSLPVEIGSSLMTSDDEMLSQHLNQLRPVGAAA